MTDFEKTLATSYATESTSKQSAKINKVILKETGITRRTLQSTIVQNTENPAAALNIDIIHERKRENGFESETAPDLRKLKAGECCNFSLDSAETLALYNELSSQYALAHQVGVDYGENQYIVIKTTRSTNLSESDESALIKLFKNCQTSSGLAEKLAKIDPELIENTYQIQLLKKKRNGIERFKRMLAEQHSEQEWQTFFTEHNWILGGVHDIQYLSDITDQPIFSGADVYGKGKRRGDYLMSTLGKARFTTFIEIKKTARHC